MICPSCGHDNPDANRFCGGCAAPLEAGASSGAQRDPRAYTPKHLADEILRSRSALEGERKQVTVLFADVKGSMELADALDAEEWHLILERYFELLADGVHRFEGTVNQYTGDGIMALFGAPIAHEDHAQRACHAALHLRDELRAFADELRERRGLDFAVRFGLNSGDVVVGKIGGDLRMDYTAQGHSVGVAARLQQLADPGKILLSDRTAALVEGYFEIGDLGPIRLAGVNESVGLYELRGPGAVRTRFDASRARGFSRFVGRTAELGTLESALEAAVAGRGQVVGIVAEAGIGKSRLCHELSERCRERGIATHAAHGLAHGRQMPMLPILELVRSVFGIEEATPARTARKRIRDRLLRRGEELRDELPLVFDLMGVPDPKRPLDPGDPQTLQQRIGAAVVRVVTTSPEPSVILIEDLQWLDAGSQAVLAHLVEATPASARLVVVNFRPEHSASWSEAPHYRNVPLVPLGSEEIRELLAHLLGNDRSVERLVERIESSTRGNPFFIEEVVQMLVDAGHLSGSPGARKLVRPLDTIAVPESVRAVLAARMDRLGEREKHVLLIASVIGKQVPAPLLRLVAGLSEPELDAALARLGETEFLHEVVPQVEYAFKHPLTEAVAYETQLRSRRAEVHATVARAIEEAGGERLDEQAARLAHHWEAAGEILEAARWHQRAAEAIGLAQPAEALRHWRRVRTLAGRLDTPEAAEQLGLACYQTLNFGWRVGLPEDVMRSIVAECLGGAGRIEPALIVRVLCAYSVCLNLRGAVRENIEPLTQALEIARAERSADMEIDVSITLADATWYLGRLAEAESLYTRVIELSGDDPAHRNFRGSSSVLESLAKRGAIRGEQGRHGEARGDVEEAIRLSEDRSLDENLLLSLMMAVHAGELSGAVAEGLPHARRLSQLALKSGSALWTLDASTFAGVAHASNGHWDEAIGLLEHVVERIDARGFPKPGLGQALTSLARAYLGAGRLPEASETAERAVRTCRAAGMQSWECMARVVLARIRLAAEGAPARRKVRAGLDRAEELIEETGAEGHRPLLHEVRASLARLGKRDDPESELREAHRLYTEMGAAGHAERVKRELEKPASEEPR